MLRFLKIIRACLPYGLVEYLKDRNILAYFASKKIFKKYYAPKYGKNTFPLKEKNRKKIIYMADGRQYARGLADWLRGMVSLYKISKELNIDFKINMTSPVDLSNYLIPNKHNWIIDENEIVYNIKESVVYDFWSQQTTEYYAFKTIKSILKKWNQIHIATNMCIADNEYGELFNELFKPSDELKKGIDNFLSEIGSDFISVSFRFMQLLGDFIDEYNYSALPIEKQNDLINRCIEHLMEIYKENYKKILVTSDSITFLNKAKQFDFVYVIPGTMAHTDQQVKNGKEVHMKTFLDYFLLTYSKKAYLVVDGQMYNSGFAYRAALHNLPYKIKRY